MKTIILTAITMLFSLPASAKELYCEILINDTVQLKSQVFTQVNKKVFIGKTETAKAFVTEKADHTFIIESYLPNADIRIYSEGKITPPHNLLILSYWGRDQMLDIKCRL